jgi:uncharacterized RDD family membrane protein YckC
LPPGTVQAGNGYINLPFVGTVPLASMGMRLLARLLDFFVMSIVVTIVFVAGVAGSVGVQQNSDGRHSSLPVLIFTFMMMMSAFLLLYEWLMVAFLGATLGKIALGLKVVKAATGREPGFGAGFVRYAIPIVGFFFCYIGAALVYLSPCFDSSGKLQGWHDMAAGTVVIKR